MPAPYFTTNESEFSRLEGMYIRERNPPAVIQGVSLNDIGVCGTAIRGPVGRAVEIGSEARFREVFGWRDQGSGGAATSNLWKALSNKPFGTLWVTRAAAAAAATADRTFSDAVPTAIIKVSATSPGIWGNNVTIDIQDATDANAQHFNMVVTYLGKSTTYKNLDMTTGMDNSLAVLGTDDGNVVSITKLADGRPANVAASALGAGGGTAGTEGSIADSDYTGTGKALEILAATPNLGAIFVAEYMSSAIRSKMATLAASATDRLFLICADSATSTVANVTNSNNVDPAAGANRSDRIVYCFNHAYTLDNDTGTEMLTMPTSWMASILSQTDIDIHPGEEDTKKFTAGITRLYYTGLQRSDYITLRSAGVCALENDEGFAFVSGVTTSLVPGKEQITRRRMTDFLQLSIAKSLKHSVKKKNTTIRKQVNAGMVQQFLDDLQRAERVVLRSVVDPDVLNTAAQEALGIVKLLVRVRLIGHILELVLETEIGTAVNIVEQ